jgi:hypothetical protein
MMVRWSTGEYLSAGGFYNNNNCPVSINEINLDQSSMKSH